MDSTPADDVEGSDLPPEKAWLAHFPVDMLDTAQQLASRGPFLVAKEVADTTIQALSLTRCATSATLDHTLESYRYTT